MSSKSTLITDSNLQMFFFEHLRRFNQKFPHPLAEETLFYSSHVMNQFGHSSKFFDQKDNRIQEYVDLVIEKMWQLRLFLIEYQGELPSELPIEQKIWLFPEFEQQRKQEDEWLNKITRDIARSLLNHYRQGKVISNPVQLADQELFAIEQIVINNKEALR